MSLSSILTRKCAACMCADSRAERPLRHEATEISIYKTTSHETHCVTGRPKSQEKTPLKHLRWLLLLLLLSHTRSKSRASHMSSYELIWAHMSSYELIRTHMNSYELIWAHMSSYELIWAHMSPHEIIWAHIGSPTKKNNPKEANCAPKYPDRVNRSYCGKNQGFTLTQGKLRVKPSNKIGL